MGFIPYLVFAILLIWAISLVIFILWLILKGGFPSIELPEKRAGRLGECFAYEVIAEILRDDDVLLNNIVVTADSKQAEFDEIIINPQGVFIIEVKNYSGELLGDEDDYEWIKNKMTPGGQFFQKTVKNPIKQVKRQIYVLSQYFKSNGINVWINGYVFFVQSNSPVISPFVLETQRDIDEAIHTNGDSVLDDYAIERIRNLLCSSAG